jgi:predicted metal-dependent peptidase
MELFFDDQVKGLYESACNLINNFLKEHHKEDRSSKIHIPQDFKAAFFSLVDKVNLSLMEDKDNFYGYFLFQMSRDIRFDISSPTAVSFKGSSYVLSLNPVIFLTLTRKQMESTIKHEVLHICSMHLPRAKEFKVGYKPVAINMAMDIVVNAYLDYLPPYATTLEWVNLNYSLQLLPFEPFEYYAEKVQMALDLLEEVDDESETDSPDGNNIETDYNPETTHDIWEDSGDIDEQTLREFTDKFIDASQKGSMPFYLESMLSALKNSKADLPWNVYLKRFMGSVESDQKKTVTRRNRRQPDRLDLRGQLRGHKAKILVALDISGSISDEEFNQAIKEVFSIVKNYNHEITLVECDSEVRRVYKVKSAKDIKDRIHIRGGTRFTPVFEYANTKKINLLVYFTDGKGEDKLQAIPKGYKTLWVVSGENKLSVKEAYGVVKKLNPVEIKENSFDMDNVEKGGYSMNNHEKIHI